VTHADVSELTLVDRIEITELLSRYSWAFDSRDGDAYVGVFTDDGELQGPTTTISGKESLRSWANDYPREPSKHFNTNVVIDGDGLVAHVSSYLVVIRLEESGLRPILMGSYEDVVHKTPNGWRINHRKLIIDR